MTIFIARTPYIGNNRTNVYNAEANTDCSVAVHANTSKYMNKELSRYNW